jgi:hypothetical protein
MTTLGKPSNDLTFENTLITESGFDKSVEILIWSAVLSSSMSLLDARTTLYPLAAKVRATCCPIFGPEPRMRMIGDAMI